MTELVKLFLNTSFSTLSLSRRRFCNNVNICHDKILVETKKIQSPVYKMNAGENEEEEQPEPEADINLIIDHVDREHTETIKSRNLEI